MGLSRFSVFSVFGGAIGGLAAIIVDTPSRLGRPVFVPTPTTATLDPSIWLDSLRDPLMEGLNSAVTNS